MVQFNVIVTLTGGQWTLKLDNITLVAKQGDITKESTDVIVNSTNQNLRLDMGTATCDELNQIRT
jgi:hypothetical protein